MNHSVEPTEFQGENVIGRACN